MSMPYPFKYQVIVCHNKFAWLDQKFIIAVNGLFVIDFVWTVHVITVTNSQFIILNYCHVNYSQMINESKLTVWVDNLTPVEHSQFSTKQLLLQKQTKSMNIKHTRGRDCSSEYSVLWCYYRSSMSKSKYTFQSVLFSDQTLLHFVSWVHPLVVSSSNHHIQAYL